MSILHKSHSYKYVDFLLKNGADPNKQDGAGRTALMMACYWNEKEIVQLLLEYNVNMDVSIYIRVFFFIYNRKRSYFKGKINN